jgi:hypothetical protein
MKKRLMAMLLVLVLLVPTHTIAIAETVCEITQQPCKIEAPLGTTGFARVEAEADGELTYRWFYWNADDEEWVDTGEVDEDGELVQEWEGYDTNTLYVPVEEDSLGQQFKCVLTDEYGNSVDSEIVTVEEGAASTKLTVETQPEDIYAKDGETGTAYVEIDFELPEPEEVDPEAEPAEEEPEKEILFSYKWLYKDTETNSWEAVEYEGCDTPEIMVPVSAENNGQRLRCLIRTADGGEIESKSITVHLEEVTAPAEPEEPAEPEIEDPEVPLAPAAISIEQQPTDIIAKTGQTGTATVVAVSAAELSYQWYYSRNGSSWTASGFQGNKTDTISVPVIAARIGQQYKCVITSEQGVKVETDVITVRERIPAEITIVTQPSDIKAKVGTTGTATVVAESESELSYKWYFSKNGTSWSASSFEGCNTPTISVPVATARVGQKYKCVITNADGVKVETEVVEVEIAVPEPSEITIVTPPEDIEAKIGEIGTATVEAESEAPLTYRWYFKAKGSDTWKASSFEGAKTETISVPVEKSRVGQQYKCVISTDDGTTVETDPVTVIVAPSEITITSQSTEMSAAIGEEAKASVEASADTGAALSYRWYVLVKGATEWKASGMIGCKTSEITVPVTKARIGQQYKCVITTADGGRVESDPVAITEKTEPTMTFTIKSNPDNYNVPVGFFIDLTVAASVDEGVTYQWYKNGEAVEGATDNRLYITAVTLEDAGEYYCVVSGGGHSETCKTSVVTVFE